MDIVSGAPQFSDVDSKKLHLLPDKEFKEEIRQLGGTPDEILRNQKFFDFFKPILKADYKIVEEYKYIKNITLDSNITVLNGKEDTIKEEELLAWAELTNKNCNIINFDGGHFFINNHTDTIVRIINEKLINLIEKSVLKIKLGEFCVLMELV